jgi:arylsulfatase A-like enzyme
VVVLLVVTGGIGCRSAERTWPVETPIVRFTDYRPPSVAGVLHGEFVEIGRDRRRTLASVETIPWESTVTTRETSRVLTMSGLPPHVRAWRTAVVDRETVVHGRATTLATAARIGVLGRVAIPLEPRDEPSEKTVVLRSGVRPEAYDVLTPAFFVPAGAVLRFAVGIDAPRAKSDVRVPARISVVEPSGTQLLWQDTPRTADPGWQEHRVPLDPWVGRTIRLQFGSRAEPASVTSATAVFADPTVLVPRAAASPPLNVLVISMDTLRAKSVGAYGCENPTTPTIDALAAEGVLFENAFSPAAYTLPGHASMVTGLWMRTHGLLTPSFTLGFEHRGLAEVLANAGWTTGGFTSAPVWLNPDSGFAGFDAFVSHDAPYVSLTATPYDSFTHGLEWMRARGGQPFFAFLHNFQVHRPYLAPPDYSDLFGSEPSSMRPDNQRLRYEREVRYADDQVRALLDGVDWAGLRDRTLVILTADHGEAFMEHGWMEHTYDVHDEIARVPLVMRLPGAIPAGRRVAEPVSLVDIMPTVLDLLGLPPAPVDGMSLLPLLTGAAERLPRDAVFTEAESHAMVGWTDLVSVHTRSHSCIGNARTGTTECYDSRVDPWQLGPPLPEGATSSGLAQARAELERWSARPPAIGTIDTGLSPKRREQLRELGYLE